MVVRRRFQGRKARRWRKSPALPTARELALLEVLHDAMGPLWLYLDQDHADLRYARARRRLLRELRAQPYRKPR